MLRQIRMQCVREKRDRVSGKAPAMRAEDSIVDEDEPGNSRTSRESQLLRDVIRKDRCVIGGRATRDHADESTHFAYVFLELCDTPGGRLLIRTEQQVSMGELLDEVAVEGAVAIAMAEVDLQ